MATSLCSTGGLLLLLAGLLLLVSAAPPPRHPTLQDCGEFRWAVTKSRQHYFVKQGCSPGYCPETNRHCCLNSNITINSTTTVSPEHACSHAYFVSGLNQLPSPREDPHKLIAIMKMLKDHLSYSEMKCTVTVSLLDFYQKLEVLSQVLNTVHCGRNVTRRRL